MLMVYVILRIRGSLSRGLPVAHVDNRGDKIYDVSYDVPYDVYYDVCLVTECGAEMSVGTAFSG